VDDTIRSVRRARALVAYWDGAQLVVQNYLRARPTVVTSPVIEILTRLTEYTPIPVVTGWLAGVPDHDAIVDLLIDCGLVVVQGTDIDRRDAKLNTSWEWSQSARWFHFDTRAVEYATVESQQKSLAEYARRIPPPSPYANWGAGSIPLPGTFVEPSGELWRTLLNRRTVRSFKREPIDLHTLATVLRWTWGGTHHVTGELGPFVLKTSPSGGGRHPIEVYPLVIRVNGIPAGLYHYRVRDNSLGKVSDSTEADAVEMLARQPWVGDAAVVFLMTAVLGRTMWKYKHSHAYRVLLLDAGHIGQTFHLVCTALGLAPFTSSAKDDEAIERALGIDGIGEIAIYTAAVGVPQRTLHDR
jgi:SagB-type dehydrogenase family enzyme